MKFKTTEKAIFDILERDRKVKDLGITYRTLANSTKSICNVCVLDFISKVREIYPNAILRKGKLDSLDNATLEII